MTWHDQGHFLCVKVDKHSKSKKTLNSVFELFRLRDKEVPIEVSEFSKDASIIAFAWEPKGIRFAVIHSEAGSQRTDVSLYTMGSKVGRRNRRHRDITDVIDVIDVVAAQRQSL